MRTWEEYENRKIEAFKEIEEAARKEDLGKIINAAIVIRQIEQQLSIFNNDRMCTSHTKSSLDCP